MDKRCGNAYMRVQRSKRASDKPPSPQTSMAHRPPVSATNGAQAEAIVHPSFWGLTLGSIGVVYGDIGTSPLYALRESVLAAVGPNAAASEAAILGILSLIIWALILIVTVKYVIILLRADNNGEGGTLALMALANRTLGGKSALIVVLGMISAALFYGDAMITPALSVLSAVEGLEVVAPALARYVVPLSVVILFALFMVQSHGTARVASFFGPITLVWFIALAAAGLYHVALNPERARGIQPAARRELSVEPRLYRPAHARRRIPGGDRRRSALCRSRPFRQGSDPRRLAHRRLPALTLNYLGQGALLLADPAAIENPFFLLYPQWALIPMVGLATAATVIASQAVITGAYSITRQAIQLGLLPRLEIRHTSEAQFGQIYIPRVNLLLLARRALLVVLFRSSGALASAYGIAVTGTMVVTAILA